MSSIPHIFVLFIHKSLTFITGLFHSFFSLFSRGKRAAETDTPRTEGQSFSTFVQLVSSQKPNRLKPFVLPQNVVLRRLEDARCRITDQEIPSSTNSSDPELGRCNVVNLRGSPRLSHPLSVRSQLPMPSFSPPSSYALPKHSHESVSRSSWPPVFDTQIHSGKNSLPSPYDTDLSTSLSSASLKVWTSSPQGKQSFSPTRPNCSYSQGAGENRFASPFGDRGSMYFAPYFHGVPSIASAADLFDFSVYASSPHVNVECYSTSDLAHETKRQEKPRFAAKISTVVYDPVIREVFTLRPSHGTRIPGHGGRNFKKLASSTPPASPISSVSDWSPSGLFTASLAGHTSSSSCVTSHARSLSASCNSSPCDFSAAEIGGVHPGSVPRVPVWPIGLPKKSFVPDSVSCPDISSSISRTTAGEDVFVLHECILVTSGRQISLALKFMGLESYGGDRLRLETGKRSIFD
ncbi:uncharacterized protein EDB91DRAFT_1245684 [Suillus paluster]|uniref:uncharacterized protein n=1 Tax=Suillus paluster TaxID=48578 RepID=UPI001B86747F|nr:uncharacterized protein EDB91DRAFT_1245684 [Suillus paluster]KAG1747255.1 hypothetical protein EDB91DRAFT_1245684 [Suillus paluster]